MTELGRAVLCVLAVSHIWIANGQGRAGDTCNTPRGERGTCLPIRECPSLVDMLRTGAQNSDVTNYLRQNICGYEGRDPIVCCPQTNSSSTGTTLPSPDVCGKLGAEIKKIVGGSDADLGLFRWITALGYRSPRFSKVTWLCAGSLVTDRHVITAAHCVVGTSDFVLSVARLGDLDLNDNVKDDATPTDYEVDTWIPHPQYTTSEKVNDIAIVRLKNKVTFTSLIQPICLPTLDEFKTRDFTGFTPFITGWGATAHRGPKTTRLQQVQIQVTDKQMCKTSYQVMKKAVIDNRVICAGEDGKDSCQGDSGGPLMMPRGRNGNFYLYGIVSYGYKCAEPGYPGVYTRVSEFMDWILPNLK